MKLGIITGSRAEYGIMRNLIKKIDNDSYFDLSLIVTGMHLEEKFGYTYKYIEQDDIKIATKIPSNMKEFDTFNTLKSMSVTLDGFNNYFNNNKFDAILVLGDRYEIYSATIAAAFHRIPIIHLHGGELTFGNYDEFIRHNITKMSNLHFTSTESYRNRVIQMGELPSNVFNVGALGVENIIKSKFRSINKFNEVHNVNLIQNKYFVVSFHPETLSHDVSSNLELLSVLDNFTKDYSIVIIGTNSDTGADTIFNNIQNFVAKNDNAILFTSLSQDDFFTLCKNSKMVVGNSSSGVIEIPSLKVPTINIGNRQKGRISASSVMDCNNKFEEIEAAIISALNYNGDYTNPYEKDNTADMMIDTLKNFKFNIIKEFYDLERR